ncbi:hypothetical protein RZS08_15225, partial [Arthrospira platensis SPKY1]|nr:hypothetical protein [Arthrospira platensis SPKY1]
MSNVILETDYAFDTYILVNCRSIIEQFLSIPLEIRQTKMALISIIQKLYPELLQYPINSKQAFYSRYNVELKRCLTLDLSDSTIWDMPNDICFKVKSSDKFVFTVLKEVKKLYILTGGDRNFEQAPKDFNYYKIHPLKQYELQ